MEINRPITIAITVFIIIIFVFFLAAPEYATFKDLREQLGEKKAEFNAKFDYYDAIAKAYNDLQSRPDDLKKIEDALPSGPDTGPLVYFFQQKALESGITLNTISLSRSASAPSAASANKLKDLTFSVNLIGSYSALENFIASLQKSARIFEVTGVSFNYGAPGQNLLTASSKYSFSLEVKTYSY